MEGVAVAEPPEGSQETPEPKSGEFLLNLPDPEEDSSDSSIEVALDEEPVLEITLTPEEDISTLKINGLNDAPSSGDKVDVGAEPVAPVLDLEDGEISLDLDEELGLELEGSDSPPDPEKP